MGRILILNQNYNSSRIVFQNAPNGIRACLDFQNFPGEDSPGPPYGNGPPAHFNTADGNLPSAERRTPNAKQNHRKKQQPNGVLFTLTEVYLALRLVQKALPLA